MTKERSKKSIIVYTLLIPIILVITLVMTILYWPQNNMKGSAKITINHGESLPIISNKLLKSGVITNEKLFGLATRIMGLEKYIPVGSYQLKNLNVNKDIINRLVYGSPEIKRITLLEGWNLKQTSNHLIKEMGFDHKNFLNIINDEHFINSLELESNTLEGYLLYIQNTKMEPRKEPNGEIKDKVLSINDAINMVVNNIKDKPDCNPL